MEDPTNLMMITGFFTFDEPLDYQTLRTLLLSRLLVFDRFSQRIIQPQPSFRLPYWEDDPNFDIDAHLHRIALPDPGDQFELQELTNDLMSSPLDFSKPLWQFHLVENYGSGCALVCRLHHSIADGIALVRVLLALTDDEATAPIPEPDRRYGTSEKVSAKHANAVFLKPLRRYRRLKKELVRKSKRTLSDPTKAADAIKFGVDGTAALAHLLARSPDPPTLFKGKLGVRKHCAWTRPIPLSEVKAIGKASGGTVNDVLLATVAGALGRYLRRQGEPIGGLDFRAVVPVNLRPPDEELKLGNAFGLVFLSLPVGVDDPLDRLNELKQRMDSIKGTHEALVAFGILTAIGAATSRIQDLVIKLFGMKATGVVTNVPGPREVRYFAEKPIREVMFWVPQSGKLGLGISILSYAGEVLVGIATDAGLVPDPEKIVEDFTLEFEAYKQLVWAADNAENGPNNSSDIDEHCRAFTKAGHRCKNRPVEGSDYCRVHVG